MSGTFTSWWVDNYLGWGQFRSPPTGPKPTEENKMETVETKVSTKAANAAYQVLWEFLSEGGRLAGINHDDVLAFVDALGTSNRIVIED